MSAKSTVEESIVHGPSGFLEYDGNMLVVDFGRIYDGSTPLGYIYDDGYLQNTSGILGDLKQLRPIEAIPGCVFRGIDSVGMQLTLPLGEPGPSGSLKYNGVLYHVINGRIAAQDHGLVGEFDNQGKVVLRDSRHKVPRRELDETSQLNTVFDGKNTNGDPWHYEWTRPLVRADKSYSDGEIIRYFMDYDKLKAPQKKYLFENLKPWSRAGILQVVRKQEGDCALGNVKHGAAGQTGVRTGNVTLDKDEFDRDIDLYYKHGPFAVVHTKYKPLCEVRVNLVVAHEFGHQVEFVLSQATQEQVRELYRAQKVASDRRHPLPDEYPGASELLPQQNIMQRIFISGYARSSFHEYWAEAVAAFTIKSSREFLKQLDPAVSKILNDVFFEPQKVLRKV
ncbi:MAG: hypothetical protein K8F91_24395, partial [Candidatus Obscuribacterales bacterium]|nr:hypothetical protein [Candidatus Obscuribacterales bacterium]